MGKTLVCEGSCNGKVSADQFPDGLNCQAKDCDKHGQPLTPEEGHACGCGSGCDC